MAVISEALIGLNLQLFDLFQNDNNHIKEIFDIVRASNQDISVLSRHKILFCIPEGEKSILSIRGTCYSSSIVDIPHHIYR